MLKKDSIRKTAITYWSDEDTAFVMESPLFDRIAGTGDSPAEAKAMFEEMLDDTYDDLARDRVAGYKRGRPAKGCVDFHCQIRPDTKEAIPRLAKKLGISQGEVVDVLVFSYLHQSNSQLCAEESETIGRRLDKIEHQVGLLIEKMCGNPPVVRSLQNKGRSRKL